LKDGSIKANTIAKKNITDIYKILGITKLIW
jgi:hypothetical protein